MKVILAKDVPNLGRSGEVRQVSDGYARNYLIPKHLAIPATTQALERIQIEQAELQARISREVERAKTLKNELEKRTFIITAKADKQTLFAAIHAQEIAEAINKKTKAAIKAEQIEIKEPIKTLGEAQVVLKLGHSIEAILKLKIEAT